MPGTPIGDGRVIGADSLVHGPIPPHSLAMGSPAKVVRSAPDFPRRPTDTERSALVATIMMEFERYLRHGGVTVGEEGPFRTYRYRGRTWRLLWLPGAGPPPRPPTQGGTALSESPLAAGTITAYPANRVGSVD